MKINIKNIAKEIIKFSELEIGSVFQFTNSPEIWLKVVRVASVDCVSLTDSTCGLVGSADETVVPVNYTFTVHV